ncbi:MAG: helix-turn-helix domain-containing protein [Kamptonema sp. SIO4C4]|nr:helix-turn-helix domain-containing protein [Kamptonema sp. SIO4C4]
MNEKKNLSANQGEKLKELGSYLREIRLKRALSLEEVAIKTRIQVRLLKAIEEAQTEVLPEPIYVRALIKQFADALDLNGSDFASAFPDYYNLQGIKPSWKHVYANQARPFHFYWVYVLVVICAVSGLSILVQRSNVQLAGQTQSSTPDNNSVVEEEETVASPEPQRSTIEAVDRSDLEPVTAENESEPDSDQVVISMTLQEDCWLKVVSDGSTLYQGILKKGEKRTWKAQEQLTIRAGNAGGVVIAINNEEAKPLGNPGAVETVTYRPPRETPGNQSQNHS